MNFFIKIVKKGGIFVHRPPTDDVAALPDVATGPRRPADVAALPDVATGPRRPADVARRLRGARDHRAVTTWH